MYEESLTKSKRPGLFTRIRKELVRNKFLYLIAIFVIGWYAIFAYGPMYGLIIAFKDYDVASGFFAGEWVGFKYFKEFFEGLYFKRTMVNTLLISFYNLIFGFPAPIIFALLLNEVKNTKFKKTVQLITYLPHFISVIVICGLVADFVSADGLITGLLTLFGGEAKNYLGFPEYFRTIFVGANIWQTIGWGSIIYLAALAGVDQELYEAASIDGAGRFRKLINITLPGIASTIIVMLILRIGQILTVSYEKIILLYNPGTYETADVISSYVYRMGLGGARYSYSTAVGVFQSVVNVILVVTANFISKKYSETSLF